MWEMAKKLRQVDEDRRIGGGAPVGVAEAALPAPSREALGLGRWLPGVLVARGYRKEWLPHDLAAGLALTALLIPPWSR
jgi:hypothetical protein